MKHLTKIMMNTEEQIKSNVKKMYGEIADKSRDENLTGCCGSATGCGTIDQAIMAEDYSKMPGYEKDADLGLGCGLPTQTAQIKEGDTVIDLGSGAGNDCFVARSIVGEKGRVIGIDFTEKMIMKAKENARKRGYNNVAFRQGDIEEMPVSDNEADVVVSNCVLNLVPNKEKVFSEIYRVLKPGGHFSISDIVLDGELPENLQEVAELYVGCVSGAIQKSDYLNLISKTGFENVSIQKQKVIDIPDEMLLKYISASELASFRKSGVKIDSITVYGEKNSAKNIDKSEESACCETTCCGN